jgi:hypothetical protein
MAVNRGDRTEFTGRTSLSGWRYLALTVPMRRSCAGDGGRCYFGARSVVRMRMNL